METSFSHLDGLEQFWDGATEGKLTLRKCDDCDKLYFYPRQLCPMCGSASTQWVVTSGRGSVYAHSIVRRSRRLAATAIIELEEGPRIPTALVNCDVHQVQIGDTVEVSFQQKKDALPSLAFTTTAAQEARAYSETAQTSSTSIPGIEPGDHTADYTQAAVIGAGRMGAGISTALLLADIPVILIDQDPDALNGAREGIISLLEVSVSKGKLTEQQASQCLANLNTDTQMQAISGADLVIEAVYEQMGLKKTIFAEMDKFAPKGATLATNTSTLDIDEIAAVTDRPGSVIGLHFFSPAHVMKLLEVVRGRETKGETIARAMKLGTRIRKVPVLVGVCYGFVGNRLLLAREKQAGKLLLEGALPDQVDRVLREFGLPMGTFELQDMAGGIELDYRSRQESGEKDFVIDELFAKGRLGQKTGKGYYSYEANSRKPRLDNEAISVFEAASAHYGIQRREISDQEIQDRLILLMVNEAAKLIEEGIVVRPSDIDVVWQFGYGWPNWKGGPVYWADRFGLSEIHARLSRLELACGDEFTPAALLSRLAVEGGTLGSATPGNST
ncbi:3-hydroxyacyl-CoA dehydrogenase NAD-binding domain-containing protein [Tropicibacter sp. Alg240-R139]|uniref:3-hydroxyacyl-CoA dehydrogenase NAD-binding domain-containing protein n=1 Tax=Tropicibacter sp. Alg240-R139 TaxID=2305991 RepID=UPI0013DF6AA9|nr:3-hydroxyacyl-CoA dehydrogenase NAD-binding domain-containing protein [Tropicibacter sp. Alg240-R139]